MKQSTENILVSFIFLFIVTDSSPRGWGGGNRFYHQKQPSGTHAYPNWGQHNTYLNNENSYFKYGNSHYNNNGVHYPYYTSHEHQPTTYYKGNNHYDTNSGHQPDSGASISFSHTPHDKDCPTPMMGDRSKFELRCILPDADVDKDCFQIGNILPSGTSVILKCKVPYINENGEIRIWVCEEGSWKGEFRSIVCIQSGYTFNFKNQSSNPTNPQHNQFQNNIPTNQANYVNNSQNYQQPNQWNQFAIDERNKSPVPSSKPMRNEMINNLFPNLIDDEGTDEVLSSTFPAWKEPVQAQPEFQHPWFPTFESWRQPTTTTTTTTTTTERPTTTTTTTVRPTTTQGWSQPSTHGWTSPYMWGWAPSTTQDWTSSASPTYSWTPPTTTPTTTKRPTTTTITTTTTRPYENLDVTSSSDWYGQYNDLANKTEHGKGNTSVQCPSLRRRTGVQLECLSKTPVSWEPEADSFLVSQSDCKMAQVVGTEATYKCQQYFESSAGLTLQYRKCKEDGTWTGGDNGFSCALECGKSNPVGRMPLITSGEPTYKAQWPWHAALFYRSEDNSQFDYNCGATLINRRVVLTAAHCVNNFYSTRLRRLESFRIDLGRHERNVEDEFVQTFSAEEIIPHPSYNPHSFDSDIAIIILRGEVTIGFHVRPICYPQTQNSAFEALHLSDGSIGTVVGFGKNEKDQLADILQMARLKVVSQQECAESFTDTNYGTTLTKSTTFCAGLKNGTNVCSGDSGGGIYFPLNTSVGTSRWYLQGLVSVGIPTQDGSNRCDPKRFSVFTRISPYADWIIRVLSEREAL